MTHASTLMALQILRAARDVEAKSGLSDLPLLARDILFFIAEAVDVRRKTLRVSDVVSGGDFGTPPTVYAHLAALEQAGWIATAPHREDGRAKVITLTPRARRLYRLMSEAMDRVMAGENTSTKQKELT